MTQEMNIKELERKAWTAYFDDGLLDDYAVYVLGSFIVDGHLLLCCSKKVYNTTESRSGEVQPGKG
ncbi:MAG: hypothetical protein HXS54_13320 [Theionarchaea archaeon]|nr:hypothetical protein [Theionarchaea archaeon]